MYLFLHWRHSMKFVVEWLKEQRMARVIAHAQGDLLDVGCGEGNSLCSRYKMQHANKTCVGADVYPWEGVDVILKNSATLPFPDASFDTVTCVAALNHIPERMEFLRETVRLLKPSGRFIMTMIPPFISRCWHAVIKPWDEDQAERGMTHEEVYGFTRKEVSEILRASGLELVHTEGFIFGLNTLYVAQIRKAAL
ncbi:class I SAM-dependent methyltransferase [Desulfovibrio sp. OttesenSCG-928-G15]|nr:class I SAM-dependent methyltransferase [Desulfovibrio sp. OttesenSCG-928-G15]